MMGERSMTLDHHTTVLMGVSLGIGLLSTFATAFAFFWFVKMKRKFRHE
jgi:G protein-coupled receptor GPR1